MVGTKSILGTTIASRVALLLQERLARIQQRATWLIISGMLPPRSRSYRNSVRSR
jgi:hypothetical protein